MNIDGALQTQIETLFRPLNSVAAANAFPQLGALSTALDTIVKTSGSGSSLSVPLPPGTASLFATAAVDVWLRGVHSFLISASLTDASPIWASVSGYYSSHYAVRAIAHLVGCFQLFQAKQIVYLDSTTGQHLCTFEAKKARGREHQFYWNAVKNHRQFQSDALFGENHSPVTSDVSHRDRANYADHLGSCVKFRALTRERVVERIQRISQIEITAVPKPCRKTYPDVTAVQLVAYHRLVKFRTLVDESLGGKNRFWSVYRNPSWARGIIDFQITEKRGLDSMSDQL